MPITARSKGARARGTPVYNVAHAAAAAQLSRPARRFAVVELPSPLPTAARALEWLSCRDFLTRCGASVASPYIERILKARVYDVAIESPLEEAARLSRRLGNTVLLKREDLQPVFSFKLRGAYNKIAHLAESAAQRGVICASAGNHAQGVALAARKRGIPATIVMPLTTPQIKVQAVTDLGGEAVLHGDEYDSAYEHALAARARAQSRVRASVRRSGRDRGAGHHRPGDPAPVAAATLDAIFVPVGGGGLICGHRRVREVPASERRRSSASSRRMRPRCTNRCAPGKRVTLDRVGIFADGVAVKRVGEETFSSAAAARRRDAARRHRRDLRRDPGRVRGHALDRRARRRARGRRR